MSKPTKQADFGYEDLRNVISKLTLERPLVGALLAGGGLGMAGYAFGPQLLYGMLGAAPGGGPLPMMDPQQRRRSGRRIGALAGLIGAAPFLHGVYSNVRQGQAPWAKYSKAASFIDYTGSQQTIHEDPFLPPRAKARTSAIFDEAILRSSRRGSLHGMLTTGDLIRGAVGAGLGWGTAAVAGPFVSQLFGLPSGIRRKLSRAGILAGALLGSGIISGEE